MFDIARNSNRERTSTVQALERSISVISIDICISYSTVVCHTLSTRYPCCPISWTLSNCWYVGTDFRRTCQGLSSNTSKILWFRYSSVWFRPLTSPRTSCLKLNSSSDRSLKWYKTASLSGLWRLVCIFHRKFPELMIRPDVSFQTHGFFNGKVCNQNCSCRTAAGLTIAFTHLSRSGFGSALCWKRLVTGTGTYLLRLTEPIGTELNDIWPHGYWQWLSIKSRIEDEFRSTRNSSSSNAATQSIPSSIAD